MKTFLLNIFRMVFVGLILVASQAVPLAQESSKGHSHENAEMHGGTVAMSRSYHFEVVFKQHAINVYLYDGLQKPLAAEGVEGEVTLKSRDGDAKMFPLKVVSAHEEMEGGEHEKMEHGHDGEKMHEEQEEHDDDHHASMSMDFLQAKVDLGKVKAGSMKAVFSLKGLPNEKESSATFTETFNGFGGDKEESHHGKMETHKH